MLSTQSSLIADFCIVYLWILTYCNYSVVTVPRGVLTWICQNPEAYKPKCIWTIKTRFASFYRYRGTPQGSVQARTLTRCSRKSPSVMAFWLVCLGILTYSCQNTSRDNGYWIVTFASRKWIYRILDCYVMEKCHVPVKCAGTWLFCNLL